MTVVSNSGSTVIASPGSGAGQTTLQGAYDNSSGADPQILLNGTPTPLSIEASVSGSILEIRDVGAANTIFEVDGDPDLIVARAGITVEDAFTNGAASTYLTFADTFTTGGGYLGGCILSNGTVTYDNSFFIWALLQESKTYNAAAGPGFAAFTLFNALPLIQNSGNFDLVQALILNNGTVHSRTSSGTSNTTQTVGLSNSPQTRATVSGAIMTKTTGDTAVNHRPTFSTVAGSTINFGTSRGLRFQTPAVALFQPQAGIENITGQIAVDVDALTFGGNTLKRALRSFITDASNSFMIDNQGGADSFHGVGNMRFNDNAGPMLGTGQDVLLDWQGSGLEMAFQALGDDLTFRNPDADRFLITAAAASEFTFECSNGYSLGDQSGANGNAFGVHVFGASSTSVNGEYAQFNLTQAGNLTIDDTIGNLYGWNINTPSITIGTGTLNGPVSAFNIGGMTTSGLSGAETQALRVGGGRSLMRCSMQYDPRTPGALAAGTTQDYSGLLTGSANNGMRHLVRLEGDGAGTSALGGIDSTAAQDGDCFKLVNVSANNVTLNHQDAGSAAANRIISPTGANYVLGQDESAEIYYDTTDSRWRILYGTGA